MGNGLSTVAKYAVRLDDACPTMNQTRWDAIESILDHHAIRPVVAIVPDNIDPDLIFSPPDPAFWDRVRRWQSKGWTIAMHGFRHDLEERPADLILPFHKRSEFGGLPYAAQADKLSRAMSIFRRERVHPRCWVAPAHGFDRTTLRALAIVTDITVVSDGIALKPFCRFGFSWMPQQLWRFRPMPLGLWTVCFHPNEMDDAACASFAQDIGAYRQHIINFGEIEPPTKGLSMLDHIVSSLYWLRRGNLRAFARW